MVGELVFFSTGVFIRKLLRTSAEEPDFGWRFIRTNKSIRRSTDKRFSLENLIERLVTKDDDYGVVI